MDDIGKWQPILRCSAYAYSSLPEQTGDEVNGQEDVERADRGISLFVITIH